MKFIKENSYNMFKMFLDQIAMTVFGTMLSFATLKNEGLLLASSIFSILFYLMLLYTVGWDIGARDKIRIDGGRMKPFPMKGFLIALGANALNILLALLIGIGVMIDTEWSNGMALICNAVARLVEGMYLGVISILEHKLFENPGIRDVWWWFLIIVIPSLFTGWLSYFMGTRDLSVSRILGIKRRDDAGNLTGKNRMK